MQVTKLPNEFLDVVLSNNGLKQYLSNLLKGKDFTDRSWLYEDIEPQEVLDRWLEHLQKLESGDAFEQNVFQFDTSQIEKWGPQGGVKPIADLMDTIVLPTFKAHDVPEAFGGDDWEKAKNAMIKQFRSNGITALRPVSLERVVDDMKARDTLESNSGWPDFTRRNKPEVKAAAVQAARSEEWLDFPAIALFRNYNQKTRLVWMFPFATNIKEGSYFQAAQSSIIKKNMRLFSPWQGFDEVRQHITRAYDDGKFLAASDFSATDEHFQLPSSYQVFDVLKMLFQKQYSSGLRQSLERMHSIPLVVGPNEMVTGRHGVSSGSNWTNFVETIFDGTLGHYVNIKTDGRFECFYAIGDDMTWVTDTYDDAFQRNLEDYGKQVGQEIKAEKTTNDPDKVKTLQRLFQRGYRRPDGQLRGVYSTVRALKSSVYPEKFHNPKLWSSDMFCARQFMILENCVDHPLFEEFVKFVCSGSRHLIPFAKKSKQELDKITRESKLLPGLNVTYNQEKRDSSLANFSSIEVARNL
nr:MAG: RNA-dependent RNA polymerase [Porcine picobirnavirus]